jgi:quinol monooxygenase YgiN
LRPVPTRDRPVAEPAGPTEDRASPWDLDGPLPHRESGALPSTHEAGTVTWYAFKLSDTTYGIFDTFENEEDREAHLDGKVPAALGSVAPDLLASDPDIERTDVVAVK